MHIVCVCDVVDGDDDEDAYGCPSCAWFASMTYDTDDIQTKLRNVYNEEKHALAATHSPMRT